MKSESQLLFASMDIVPRKVKKSMFTKTIRAFGFKFFIVISKKG